MHEIYAGHAVAYDELVNREDHQGNLGRELLSLGDFSGARVVEFGAGTGRVTRLYADYPAEVLCLDGSPHMLETARKNLSGHGTKLRFAVCDNLERPGTEIAEESSFDWVIEGWAFGHSVLDSAAPAREVCRLLIENASGLLARGGSMVIIETLGTNSPDLRAPTEKLGQFYASLESDHGFDRRVVRTDYLFETPELAQRILGFFFGPQMGEAARKITPNPNGSLTVPEYTGIWHRRF